MILRAFVTAALVAASAGAVAATPRTNPAVAAGEPGLVGTWRLVRFEDTPKGGAVTYPFGEHPKGYFVYDPTGHLSINIMKNPPPPPFASGDEDKGTDAEKIAAYDAYVAYFGTYRVDKVHHVLHHVVEGALNTVYTNTDQLRPYRLKGDVLVIEIFDPKDGMHNYRELHRVK